MHFSSALLLGLAAGASAHWTKESYDVIVVGSGPAGIIAAERMAEANLKTLLLEGGGQSYGITGGNLSSRRPEWLEGTDLTRVDVPGLYSSIFSGPSSLLCGALIDAYGACTIGGNSAINAGLFFQPPASDYNLYLPDGWKAKDVAAATKRLYAMQPSTNLTSSNGVRYEQSGYVAARKWLVDGLGYADVDINAKADNKTKVFGYPIYDYTHAQRGGPVTNYLQKALRRSNFHFKFNVRVNRVVRNHEYATGVVVTVDGVEKTIRLNKGGRVILSGGAIQSPSILMHSAIGDPATLTKLANAGKLGNVTSDEWINSTAIGNGLFDNPNTFIELQSPAVESYVYSYASPPPTDEELYLKSRSGPYTFAGETSVFWDTTTNADGSITAFQGTIGTAGYDAYTTDNTMTLNVYGTSGLKSSGRVVLDDNFVPGPDSEVYYSNPQDATDIAGFIHGIFAGLPAAGLTPLNLPQNSTVEQIRTYITTTSAYARGMVNHWSSSCRIGACVDVNTVVTGTKNLHVVDASIVQPLTVNPQFGVMVAAERASELILKLHGKKIGGGGAC